MSYHHTLSDTSISTYTISSSKSPEQLSHIQNQFKGRNEFNISLVDSSNSSNESVRIWQNISQAVRMAIESDESVIVVCKDDHEFTPAYSRELFWNEIIEGAQQGAKVLLGGAGIVGQVIPVSKNRLWFDIFEHSSFMILFRPVFELILAEQFSKDDTVYEKISEITSHKMVIFPYISIIKDFDGGRYSDHNSDVNKMYEITQRKLKRLVSVNQLYSNSIVVKEGGH